MTLTPVVRFHMFILKYDLRLFAVIYYSSKNQVQTGCFGITARYVYYISYYILYYVHIYILLAAKLFKRHLQHSALAASTIYYALVFLSQEI